MKKGLLLFVAVSIATLSYAQPCMRDSNILQTTALLSPAPYTPDSPFYNLKTACINELYNQSVTVHIPMDFSGFPLDSVNIPVTGGISNLPVGISYVCDPPNCRFLPNTLGCIQLTGTPTAANTAPDTVDLGITALVATPLFTLPVTFPGTVAPGSHYYLILNPNGQCASAATEPGSPFSLVRARPNPFSDRTIIEVQSTETGRFEFEVFDLLGHRLHTEAVQLFEGANQIPFDSATLPTGTYLYTIGNLTGKSVRRMVKN